MKAMDMVNRLHMVNHSSSISNKATAPRLHLGLRCPRAGFLSRIIIPSGLTISSKLQDVASGIPHKPSTAVLHR